MCIPLYTAIYIYIDKLYRNRLSSTSFISNLPLLHQYRLEVFLPERPQSFRLFCEVFPSLPPHRKEWPILSIAPKNFSSTDPLHLPSPAVDDSAAKKTVLVETFCSESFVAKVTVYHRRIREVRPFHARASPVGRSDRFTSSTRMTISVGVH